MTKVSNASFDASCTRAILYGDKHYFNADNRLQSREENCFLPSRMSCAIDIVKIESVVISATEVDDQGTNYIGDLIWKGSACSPSAGSICMLDEFGSACALNHRRSSRSYPP